MGWTGIIGDQGAGKTLFETLIVGQEAERIFNADPKMTQKGLALNYDVDLSPLGAELAKTTNVYRFSNDLQGINVDRLRNRHVFFDDLQALFDLRFREYVPPRMRLFFATHRHYNCQITYTVPNWSRADKDIRINTNRLLHVKRWGRLLMINIYGVKVDEADATGQSMRVFRKNLLPKMIWLPFTPKDDIYPIRWRTLRRIAKVVAGMYDTWAAIELTPEMEKPKPEPKRYPDASALPAEAPPPKEKIIMGVKQK